MNETQIVYFLNLAQCGSFTETAYKLYVSQSAVSKQISALEKDLGCKLFLRHKNSLRLTKEGEMYKTFFARFIEDLKQMREKTDLSARGFLSSISICVKENVYLESLPICIQILSHSYPDVSIKLTTGPCMDVHKEFNHNLVNVVITYADLIGSISGLKSLPLRRVECQLIISKTHPLSYRHSLGLNDFTDCKFFVPAQDEDRFGRTFVENLCLDNGFYPAITESAPNMNSIFNSVECGLGVAIVDSGIRMHASGNFRTVPLDSYRELVAVWNIADKNPTVPIFMDILKKNNRQE